jgi:hypothetical protein
VGERLGTGLDGDTLGILDGRTDGTLLGAMFDIKDGFNEGGNVCAILGIPVALDTR